MDKSSKTAKLALTFIVLMGVVSMFSDMTHESARGIMGAYLSLAGASAAAIGFVSGLGEMLGYSLRLLSGVLADRTKKYWPLTIAGYIVDVFSVPALALVPRGGWIWACALVIVERTAKAVKKPAKDTLLSFAAAQNGVGKSFAIQEFLDQLGAFLGPTLLFVVLYFRRGDDVFASYSLCFAVLAVPAFLTMALLLAARKYFPNPENFEPEPPKGAAKMRLDGSFMFYTIAISCFAFGFADFTLITMHAARSGLFQTDELPLIYAGAMAVDAVAALVFGWLYDKYGLAVLMLSSLLAAPFAFFAFGVTAKWAMLFGAALWGVGMGAQESILKAAVTSIVPKQNRSSGFGISQTAFGIAWFLGSWLMGALYDASMSWMITVSVAAQLAAVPFFWLSARKFKKA